MSAIAKEKTRPVPAARPETFLRRNIMKHNTPNTPEIYSIIMDITPAQAALWLEKNLSNRPISHADVTKISSDIMSGKWILNGESIRVGSNGELYDGQHRCLAIVNTGVTVRSNVVFNIQRKAQRTMDSGKPRTLSDQLAMDGYKNSTRLGAVLKQAHLYESGSRHFRMQKGTSISEYFEWLDEHPEIVRAAQVASKVQSAGLGIPAGIAGVAYWVFSQIDEEDADCFFDELVNPAHPEGSPILALRESLRREKDRLKGGQIGARWVAALVFKAWNRWRSGENNISFIRFKTGGAKPEAFPEAV